MQTETALPDDTRPLEHTVAALERHPLTAPELPDDTDDDAPPRRLREGLPKTYRSRHDRHYVEQLVSGTGMPLLRMLAVSRIDASNLPDPSEVTALTASVARLGVLQPLLVRAHGDRFVLIAGRKRLVAAREAHCREVPCLVHTADEARAQELAEAANATPADRRERVSPAASGDTARAECDPVSDAVLPEIHHALASVGRALRLLPQAPPTTRERVAMRLVAAELERAQWLVKCRRYLAGRLASTMRSVPIADVATELRSIAPGIALHGGQFDVDVAGAPSTVTVDTALMVTAVHGLAWALVALGETAGDSRVRLTVTPTAPPRAGSGPAGAVLALTQPTIVLNQATLLRFFEAGWKSRPGGASAELAVQLARYAAARHGADLEVSSGSAIGTTITLTLR